METATATGSGSSPLTVRHTVLYEAYKLDGTFMWRVCSGPNIILGNSSSFAIADFDGELTHAGGQSNAWTSTDYTNFFDILPAANIETALWLESDRMLSLAFAEKPLEVQRQVVVEEFKQVCLNRPYGDSEHLLRAMCYTTHPYRTPVIGKEFAHIEQVTQDDVRRWFAAHYAPNNAVALRGRQRHARATSRAGSEMVRTDEPSKGALCNGRTVCFRNRCGNWRRFGEKR